MITIIICWLTFLVSALGRSGVGEGVGDLQEEKTGGDQADGVGLKMRNCQKLMAK